MHIAALIAVTLIATPALAQKPDPRKAELDQLLGALPSAPSEEVAVRMEHRAQQLWLQSGGPTVALLMSSGARNLNAGNAPEAVADLDAAIVLAPDCAEAFSRRALARFEAGDIKGAWRDIQEALQREPRHFGALQALSTIAEKQGNWAGALAAWKQVLAIDPHTEGAERRLKDLTKHAEGEEM